MIHLKRWFAQALVATVAIGSLGVSAGAPLGDTQHTRDRDGASAFPESMVSADYVEADAAGEPYLIKCAPHANRIILFLHTWSNDYHTVKQVFPELVDIDRACIVAPNFNGPNNTPGALGADDTMNRIDRALKDAQRKTALRHVDLVGVSGGTFAALNYMGKYPGNIRFASLWFVIYDLASLYTTTQDPSLQQDMLKVLGAAPVNADDPAYLSRSPRARLSGIKGHGTIVLNVGAKDTTSPPEQAYRAKAQINARAPGIHVSIKTWPIPHEFAAPIRQEALKQLARD